jgi:hypothetical protein
MCGKPIFKYRHSPAATTGDAVGKSTMIEQPAQTRYAGDLVSTKEGEQIA